MRLMYQLQLLIISLIFLVPNSSGAAVVKRSVESTGVRNYQQQISQQDKNNVAYIVNSLGMEPLYKIPGLQSSLKGVGAKVEHIHPLRFLALIFTDEQMKASMQAMRSRTWIYDEFLKGLKQSLEKESSRGNLTLDQAKDFSKRVDLSFELIRPPVEKRQWANLVETLIAKVPRKNNPNRYNM